MAANLTLFEWKKSLTFIVYWVPVTVVSLVSRTRPWVGSLLTSTMSLCSWRSASRLTTMWRILPACTTSTSSLTVLNCSDPTSTANSLAIRVSLCTAGTRIRYKAQDRRNRKRRKREGSRKVEKMMKKEKKKKNRGWKKIKRKRSRRNDPSQVTPTENKKR